MDDFLPYYSFAKNQAWRISNNRELAEDLVQDLFFKLYKYKIEIPGDKNFKAYLTMAIRNNYLTYYTKNKKWKFDDIEEYHNVFYDALQSKLISDDLKGSLEDVSENLKLPFMLNTIYGYTYAEIAKILDIPEGTVKNRIFRAKEFLREQLIKENN